MMCKIALLSNNPVEFPPDDLAMRDRVVNLPFNARFVDRPRRPNEFKKDEALVAHLESEAGLEEMFAYIVQGAIEYLAMVFVAYVTSMRPRVFTQFADPINARYLE